MGSAEDELRLGGVAVTAADGVDAEATASHEDQHTADNDNTGPPESTANTTSSSGPPTAASSHQAVGIQVHRTLWSDMCDSESEEESMDDHHHAQGTANSRQKVSSQPSAASTLPTSSLSAIRSPSTPSTITPNRSNSKTKDVGSSAARQLFSSSSSTRRQHTMQ